MIKKRQAASIKYEKDSLVYKLQRNRVQHTIKTAKSSYYSNKVDDLAITNSKKLWKDIKSLTRQNTPRKQQWYQHTHQLCYTPVPYRLLHDSQSVKENCKKNRRWLTFSQQLTEKTICDSLDFLGKVGVTDCTHKNIICQDKEMQHLSTESSFTPQMHKAHMIAMHHYYHCSTLAWINS